MPNREAGSREGQARKSPVERLIALTDWPAHYPWPTVPGLRKLIFKAADNGADRWIRRVGRRVLIVESEFFRWVEEQNERTSKPDIS